MLTPALKALAAACFPELDWLAAEKAAYQPCRCTCCGNSHQITRRRGVYLNGRLVADIIQEAINQHVEIEYQATLKAPA